MATRWILFLAIGKLTMAQVTMQNPLIWQTLVSPYSSNNFDYVSDSTSKYYSQDFQTILPYNDNYGHNERLLIHAGDGCHDVNMTGLATYNNGLNAFVKRQPVMGLVTRGGCAWSTKLATMKKLVLDNSNLDMTGLLLYDNLSYVSDMIRLLPSQQHTTPWQTPLPLARNISHMPDNDLNVSDFMAIYFVPHAFAQDMLGKMNNTNSHYVMLAPYFTDQVMDDNPSSTPKSDGGADNVFGYGNRGYIAYLIAAGAAILLAVILFRWCRSPRFGLARYRQRNDTEQALELPPRPPRPALPCVPMEQLDAMCVAQPASKVEEQMKNSMCAVCLDDFKPTSIIRLLPCHHGFCVACIDFWLTKKSSLCPICKYDCLDSASSSTPEQDLGTPPPYARPPTP